MFEEEAKKHKEEFITTYINVGGGLNAADMIGMQKEQSYQEGAEFGYNKAMECHFVKDGEYPTHSISKNCHVSQAEKKTIYGGLTMAREYEKYILHSVEYRNTSTVGNPSYLVYFTNWKSKFQR